MPYFRHKKSFLLQICTIKMNICNLVLRTRRKYVHLKTHWALQVMHQNLAWQLYYGKISFAVLVPSLLWRVLNLFLFIKAWANLGTNTIPTYNVEWMLYQRRARFERRKFALVLSLIWFSLSYQYGANLPRNQLIQRLFRAPPKFCYYLPRFQLQKSPL